MSHRIHRRTPLRLAAVLALVPAAGLAPAATAQEAAAQGAPAEADAPQNDAAARRAAAVEKALDEPLVVGGTEVPEKAVRRALAYAAGAQMIESRKMDLFIEEEIERQVSEGAERSDFFPSEEEVDEQLTEALGRLEEEYPENDIEEILAPRLLDQGQLRGQVKQTELFDRVFLPPNPHDYPETTIAALQAQAGQDFVDKLVEGYELRIEKGLEVDESDTGHLMWKNIMRQFVMKSLNEHADIKTASDGLPPDVLLEVNGRKITTDEIFDRLLQVGRLSPHDVKMTRLWLAKTEAVEQDLREKGYLIGPEEFEEIWREEEEPYKDSPFNLQVIAVGFRKFPSVDAYRRYFHLLKSYERMIADEITEEALDQHIDERANAMLGLGRVRADVILLSAFEMGGNRFRENGWEDARARAIECAEALAAGASWDEMIEKYSDFKDAPVPVSQKGNAPPSYNKGRFPLLHRNELVQRMGESDFWMFLTGTSVVDHIFFDQEVGTIDGPFEGVMGYYITKVIQRTDPGKQLSIENEGQRDLVVQDYVAVRFNEYAADVLDAAQVKGLDYH